MNTRTQIFALALMITTLLARPATAGIADVTDVVGGTFTASDFFTATFAPSAAVDNNNSTAWLTPDGQVTGWWQVEFNAGYQAFIESYTITARDAFLTRSPRNWTLQGSNDGANWTTVDTVVGETGWGSTEQRSFTVDSPGSYNYYRIDVTLNDGDAGRVQIAEVELLETLIESQFLRAAVSGHYFPGMPQTIEIEITDLAGLTVDDVEFLVNGQLIGTDDTPAGAEYSVAWTPVALGAYSLQARVNATNGRSFPIFTDAVAGYDFTDANPAGAASASSEFSATFSASNCFDNSAADLQSWVSAATPSPPAWLKYQFLGGDTHTVEAMTLTPRDFGDILRQPSAFTLQGSNDDSNWDDLLTTTGVTYANTMDTKYIEVPEVNRGAYRYHRILITSNPGASDLYQIGELELLWVPKGEIEVTQPAGGVSGSIGTPTAISATVTTATNPLTAIHFYVNGELIASETPTGGSASTSFTPTSGGTYSIVAVGEDNAGNYFVSENDSKIILPLYVKQTGTGNESGNSWANAIGYDDVMANLTPDTVLYLSSGTFTLSANQPIIDESVTLYGGFLGTETDLADRAATFQEDSPTTIDCVGSYRAYSVVSGSLTLNGVNIANGSASGQPQIERGGAILGITGSQIFATHCRMVDCVGASNQRAGTIYLDSDGNNVLLLDGCLIDRSYADNSAGAVLCNPGTSVTMRDTTIQNTLSEGNQFGAVWLNATAHALIENCRFLNNVATDTDMSAAALFVSGGNTLITGSVFENNSAYIGGAFSNNNAEVRVENCVFRGNTATGPVGGGAIYSLQSLTLINNTFVDNRATMVGVEADGYAISAFNDAYVVNNIFAGHREAVTYVGLGGNQGQMLLSHNLLEGHPTSNTAQTVIANDAIVSGSPAFTNAAAGDFSLSSGSVAINQGVATIELDGVTLDAPALDIAGTPRPPLSADIGAYQTLIALTHIAPETFDYGLVLEGDSAATNFSVENAGNVPVTLSDITVDGEGYSITAGALGGDLELAFGESQIVTVTFTPPSVGFRATYPGELIAVSDASDGGASADLTGDGAVTAIPGDRPSVTVSLGDNQPTTTTAFPIIFNIEFSEGVEDFEVGDLTFVGDYLASSVTATLTPLDPDNATYELAVTGLIGAPSGTVAPFVSAGVASSVSGNSNTSGTGSASVFYDGAELGVTLFTAAASPTDASTVTFTVNFTEATNVPDANTLATSLSLVGSASGASILTVTETAANESYEVVVETGAVDGTLALALLDDDTIQDAGETKSLNGVGTGTLLLSNSIVVDQSAPQIASITRYAGAPAAFFGAEVYFLATFSDAVVNVDAADFTRSLPGASITGVNGFAANHIITVNTSGLSGKLNLAVDPGASIQSLTGETYAGGTPSPDEFYLLNVPVDPSSARDWSIYR